MLKLSSSTSNEAFLQEGIYPRRREGDAISAKSRVSVPCLVRAWKYTHARVLAREGEIRVRSRARACVTLYVTIITHQGLHYEDSDTSSYNAVTLYRNIFRYTASRNDSFNNMYIYIRYIYPHISFFFLYSFVRFPIRRHEAYGLHSSI